MSRHAHSWAKSLVELKNCLIALVWLWIAQNGQFKPRRMILNALFDFPIIYSQSNCRILLPAIIFRRNLIFIFIFLMNLIFWIEISFQKEGNWKYSFHFTWSAISSHTFIYAKSLEKTLRCQMVLVLVKSSAELKIQASLLSDWY